MSDTGIRAGIKTALKSLEGDDLPKSARALFGLLGYESERILQLDGDPKKFTKTFPSKTGITGTKSEKDFLDSVKSIDIIFQITDEEIKESKSSKNQEFNVEKIKSFLFIAVQLNPCDYARGAYAQMAREVNKRIGIPAVVLFMNEGKATISFMDRRAGKINPNRDVLGKVFLIRDINCEKPHRAHVDILADLSLSACSGRMEKEKNFEGLLAVWLKTLNTEELNKDFYKRLYKWYLRAVKKAIFPSPVNKPVAPQDQVIRLITRILFVWFIKEKHLVSEDLFDEGKVRKLLKDYRLDGDDYYCAILQNLFFATLNTEIRQRKFSGEGNATHRNFNLYRYKNMLADENEFLDRMNKSPFINGGLFDCLDSEESTSAGGYRLDCFTDNVAHRKELSVPNSLFFDEKHGLFPLLDKYKFTVEENTPIEQEVALDPELLGKVFENLLAAYNPETSVTARQQTGSFYTPRTVVDYMVDEVLLAYLSEKVAPGDGDAMWWSERLRYLLDYADAFDDAEELFTDKEKRDICGAVADIRVLDPAVGSGAFPMGVLHKLSLVLRRVDSDNVNWEKLQRDRTEERLAATLDTPDFDDREEEQYGINWTFDAYRKSDFGRKLYLIQNSIFGVDIQPIACQIAKLRFFISLAIEQKTNKDADNNYGIRALPNLETRFVSANTLLGIEKPKQMGIGQTANDLQELERQLRENRERHFNADTRQKKLACRKKDEELRQQLREKLEEMDFPPVQAKKIADWKPYDQNETANWFSSEYMFWVDDGFDVVIGNPPYAKTEHLDKSTREELMEKFGWLGDLYDHFIFRGMELTAENGVFSYIANDSYVALSTKKRIRELILKHQLTHLVRAPAQTFDASIYAAIFVILNKMPSAKHSYLRGKINDEFKYQEFGLVKYEEIHQLPDKQFLLSDENGLPLSRFQTFSRIDEFCQILDTGIDSGNVRLKLFYDEDDGTRARLLQGKQINRFSLDWDSPKAKYKFCNADYKRLPIPGIGRGGKPSKKNEYWNFRGPRENHHQPERLLMRQTDDDLVVAYHSEEKSGQFYTDNTLFTIFPKTKKADLKYLLALLNSRILNYIYQSISQEAGKSQAQVKVKTVRQLPAVLPEAKEQNPIIKLVDQILAAKTADPSADTSKLEAKIDHLVYTLYGLTDEEIKIVEEKI